MLKQLPKMQIGNYRLQGHYNAVYWEKCKRLINGSNIGEKVIYKGMLRGSDRLNVLAAASLWIAPYTENFGVAILEALSTVYRLSLQIIPHGKKTSVGAGFVTPVDVKSVSRALKP